MATLIRPVHPTLHKNANGSKFECLQTEDNSFWLLQYQVYVLISITEEDMQDYGAFEEWWGELNYEGKKECVSSEYYSHHISSYDVSSFLSACHSLPSGYQLNSWQQRVYKLWLQDKAKQKAQDKDFADVAKMINYMSFDFSDPEAIQVY